jgi:hypothetical protein
MAVTGLLLGGSDVAARASSPVGSRSGTIQRATLVDAPFVSGAWSGYVVKGGYNSEVSATFTMPVVYCQFARNYAGTAFWVGIQSTDSSGNATIVQDGINVACVNGQPGYGTWMVPSAYAQQLTQIPDPVQPLDTIDATVIAFSGGLYAMMVQDTTENWFTYKIVTGGDASSNWAAVAAESYYGGAFFNPVAVTGAQVNWAPLLQSSPEADEQGPSIYDGTAGLDPSSLDASGQNFIFYWNGTPGNIQDDLGRFPCCVMSGQ